MRRINILYSALMSGYDPQDSYWSKKTCHIRLTSRGEMILSILRKTISAEDMPLISCILCRYAHYGKYGRELALSDNCNTYNDLGELDGHVNVFGKLPSCTQMMEAVPHLDEDIRKDMEPATWVDMLSGICLQLVREVL